MDVIAIFGPTGVGKTDVALAVAQRLRARGEDPVAVSADALQVYAGLEVLTGVAGAAHQRLLEHRLVSFVPVTETFSAGAFAERAHAEIDALLSEGRRPIVVGGTGLYLRAALADLQLRPPPDPEVRARWSALLAQRGPEHLHALLGDRSAEAAAGIAATDAHRLVRTLELLDAGQVPPVLQRKDSELWTTATRHPTRLIGLTMQREALFARIEQRIAAMIAGGAADEVRRAAGAGASETARKALGFAELLRGDEQAMLVNTRRYAKRQLTWMRKLAGVELVDLTDRSPEDVADELLA